MKGMTGFGHSEFQNESFKIVIETKSYNNRYCDIVINSPSFIGALEQKIRKTISKIVQRGRVECYIRIKELEDNSEIIINEDLAENYFQKISELADKLNVERPLIEQILSQDGVITHEKKRDMDTLWSLIEPLLQDSLSQLDSAREIEGLETKRDIEKKIESISFSVEEIKKISPLLEEKILSTIKEKFIEVLGEEVDENRVLTELSSYLIRYDINEEISRLTAHLDSFRKLLSNEGAIGKKIDFICQEVNREINTIGSKSVQMDIQNIVISVKDNVEQIREQVRNVE